MPDLSSADVLGTSPAFVNVISNRPDGHTLMSALCGGPMARYEAVAASLHGVDGDRRNLLLAGHHGFDQGIDDYQAVPVEWDFPITRVFHSTQPLILPTKGIDETFPLLVPLRDSPPDDDEAVNLTDLGSTLVVLPILYAGTLTGVCTVITRLDGPWDWPGLAHLQGTSAAIGLWQRISHLDGAQDSARRRAGRGRIPANGLTNRQHAIIELIRDGKSNASIAKSLGFSVGTIKAEVQYLLTLLSARNRKEIVERADLVGITGVGDRPD